MMTNTTSSMELTEDTYWEKVAKTRWGRYISAIEQQMILKANDLADKSPAHTSLEIGCEGGRWSELLAGLGWDTICTDIVPRSLEICQKRIPTAKCILVDKDDETLPCESSSIGLLLCVEVFPVINSEWFIPEAFRVLSPGGLVVGVFLNKRSFRAAFHNLVRSSGGEDNYYSAGYWAWRTKVREQGFKFIKEEGIGWPPFSRDSNSKLIPLFTSLEQILGLRGLPNVSPWIVFLAQKGEDGI